MDLQSIATESQALRSTIRDLRSVITTDKERLARHEEELRVALHRLDEIETEASMEFQAIRGVGLAKAEEPAASMTGTVSAVAGGQLFVYSGEQRANDSIGGLGPSPFGEPNQVAAE